MFKPGDEVIYIGPVKEKFGTQYTIAAFLPKGEVPPGMFWPLSNNAVQLSEIGEHVCFERGVWGFIAAHFSKVQKRSTETGMAILKKIADNPNIKIKEDA